MTEARDKGSDMPQNTFDFRDWIRNQRHDGYTADFSDDDHFVLQTDYAVAHISFYNMDPDPEVVEFRIENRSDNDVKFFLHFHAEERDHAIQLFREMIQTLLSLEEQQVTEVLLCCTAGMTTTFFAEKLNQVAEAMGLNWQFSAVAVNEAYEHGRDKAAVLVAPQIGYQTERIAAAMGEVPVLAIPTAIFASYDAAACVEWVRDELANRKKTAEQLALEHVSHDIANEKKILVIAAHSEPNKVNIRYRLYDCGNVTLDRTVIKRKLNLEDLSDIIDTQVCACTGTLKADAVGIAIPGSVNNGQFSLGFSSKPFSPKANDKGNDLIRERDLDISQYFRERYDVPIFFCNNSDAAALGWYASQDEYQNITFHSQPRGWAIGGQGNVVNGRLVEGAHGIAGEMRFIAERLQYSHPLHFNGYAPDDVLEMVGQMLAISCATYDPEVIALRCELLPDMNEVADELAKYIPRDRQPVLRRVEHYHEYILLGMMVLCVQRLAEGSTASKRSWKISLSKR